MRDAGPVPGDSGSGPARHSRSDEVHQWLGCHLLRCGRPRLQIRRRPAVLVELRLVEQRYKAVCEVLNGATVVELVRRNEVARQTVHDWLRAYAARGLAGLTDRSSKPADCPHQTPAALEARDRGVAPGPSGMGTEDDLAPARSGGCRSAPGPVVGVFGFGPSRPDRPVGRGGVPVPQQPRSSWSSCVPDTE